MGLVYEAVNEPVLSVVPRSAVSILDIGCGNGALGERLRQARECHIVGITYSQQEAELANVRLSRVICADLNSFDFSDLGQFDCVIMSHILEHLYSPESFLERLKCVLRPESAVVVALPNVLFWKQRKEFVKGRWRYQDGGIMDRTHFRFFDCVSSKELLVHSGYEILRSQYSGAFPLTRVIRRLTGPLPAKVDRLMCSLAPGLFAFQFVYLSRLRQ